MRYGASMLLFGSVIVVFGNVKCCAPAHTKSAAGPMLFHCRRPVAGSRTFGYPGASAVVHAGHVGIVDPDVAPPLGCPDGIVLPEICIDSPAFGLSQRAMLTSMG